jgi:hypothetical protein
LAETRSNILASYRALWYTHILAGDKSRAKMIMHQIHTLFDRQKPWCTSIG